MAARRRPFATLESDSSERDAVILHEGPIRFADYGFGPPRRPIVGIGGSGTIEFRLRFSRSH